MKTSYFYLIKHLNHSSGSITVCVSPLRQFKEYFEHISLTNSERKKKKIKRLVVCTCISFSVINKHVVYTFERYCRKHTKYGTCTKLHMFHFFFNFPKAAVQGVFLIYNLLRPFPCFTINQFAHKFKFLDNLITCFVNVCNIYEVNYYVNP